MSVLGRRTVLGGLAAAAGSGALPRISIGRAEDRPSLAIAVQKIANTNTLDVLREQSNVGERIFFSSLWESLIGRDWSGDLRTMPGLATHWRRLDDRTIEFALRPGVRFHNGDELTAADVAFSFGRERMFGDTVADTGETLRVSERPTTYPAGKVPPPEVPAVARRAFPALVSVDVVDRYTVRFVNGTPDITLEGRIGRYGGEIASQRGFREAGSYLEWARNPITTGPYRVAAYEPDRHLILEAHDAYWGGRPPLKRIRFVEVPEATARIDGLLSGEYDFACDIPPDQIDRIERDPTYEVQGGPVRNHRILVFDKTHPVLADPRIRRALTHAIDRDAIVAALWAERTSVPKGLQWPHYGDLYIADWSVPAYDPALARNLVREAGYRGEPIPYRLLPNYYTNQLDTAQILVETWRQVGLNVDIHMKENTQQVMERSPDRAVRDWSNSAPFGDPVSSLVAQHGPNGQQQQIGEYANAELNRLCLDLERSTDQSRRRSIFHRLLTIAEREDPAYTVLHQNATFTAKRKAIRWKASPAFAMDFRSGNCGARA